MSNEIKLKICGMREEENIRQVAALDPDFMGFIFFEKSPRFVGGAFKIPKDLGGIKRVGVFVNESTDEIIQKATEHRLDYAQLHGHETVEQCQELKQHKIKIIKAFAVDDQMNFPLTKPYREACDFFLFDTKGKYFGGNARTFNWSILTKYDQHVPFFLSGGIDPGNIKAVNELRGMNLHAVDVNSGVEISPGVKSTEKISRLKEILNSKR